jgi:hypothetical protein
MPKTIRFPDSAAAAAGRPHSSRAVWLAKLGRNKIAWLLRLPLNYRLPRRGNPVSHPSWPEDVRQPGESAGA